MEIENTRNFIKDEIKKGPKIGMRHVQAGLLFLDIAIFCINRLHAAVTIVAMTNAERSNPDFPEFDWNEKEKSYILSSFYWGYVVTQFPGGYLVRRFGVKLNLFIYTFLSGILSLVVPLCISWGGWEFFCVIRFLQGFVQGGFYPGMLQNLAKWSPPDERRRLSGLAHTGFDCGIVLAMAMSGVIAASPLGWPGVFYISSALCFIWCIFWVIFGANDAANSKWISKAERSYIEESLKHSIDFNRKNIPIPWRKIFTSKPFYALLLVRTASETGFFTINAEWPAYLNAVFKMDIRDNALFASLPALTSWMFVYIFIFSGDLLTNRKILSVGATRKLFNSIAHWLPSVGMVCIGFLNKDQMTFAIVLMTLSVALHGGVMVGSILCSLDMAPNHTSIIVSIINLIANIFVLLGPIYTGLVVSNEEDRSQWLILFATIAVIFILGDIVFLIWGTSEEQPWNSLDFVDIKDQEKRKNIKNISSPLEQGLYIPTNPETEGQYI